MAAIKAQTKWFLWVGVIWVAGCAPKSPDRGTVTPSAKGSPEQTDSANAGGKDSSVSQAFGDLDREPTPEEIAPFLFQPKREVTIMPYQQPTKVTKRLQQKNPELVVPRSRKFSVDNQNLKIDSKNGVMIFTGKLKVPGKRNEDISLSCEFDPNQPWECGDMFPTNESIAKQKRLQARVSCIDTYRCNRVGLELFVLIDGKIERQTFQSQQFEIRRAGSGDDEDYYEVAKPPKGFRPKQEHQDPRKLEKPTPKREDPKESETPEVENEEQVEYGPLSEPEEPLTTEEVERLIQDPNVALEVESPVTLPDIEKDSRFSIDGIDKLEPDARTGVREQAIGKHSDGRLQSSTELSEKGPGFKIRGRKGESFGTDRLVRLLKSTSLNIAQADTKGVASQSPFVVAAMSNRNGGRMCGPKRKDGSRSCHASHQTGLDVDVVFPSLKPESDMWNACDPISQTYRDSRGRTRTRRGCRSGRALNPNFDTERFWQFLKTTTCADNKPVIAMFVDKEVKRHMCQFVKTKTSEDWQDPKSCAHMALKVMKHWPGHHNHVHMRLKCPGNRRCRESTVDLGNGTGC